ncbi:MAG: HAD family phosphatase [Flavobacteriales bacterium]|nr:HAD family phosphatase [Flavobacteriales bacterium]
MKGDFNLKGIETIIFDLGMVIINLDMEKTIKAFKSIYGDDYEPLMNKLNEEGFFNAYETGRISTKEFTSTLATKSNGKASEQDIANAWNAMLLDIPPIRFEILKWAKANFNTYCLSNTNELHIDWINKMLKIEFNLENLGPYFHKVYLSHEMHQRKPDVEIFETVIKNHNLNPSNALFIDDTAGHLLGAKQAGLKTYHLTGSEKIEDLISISK